MNVLIVNGSLGGSEGNSYELAKLFVPQLTYHGAQVEILNLNPKVGEVCMPDLASLESQLTWADAFVFVSGTYWSSWGSPMQMFIEHLTNFETSPLILGKPASVLITMHSVGGQEVMFRLQGVLASMGFLIPPLSSMVYSLHQHLIEDAALENTQLKEHKDDFWSLRDLPYLAANLIEAIRSTRDSNFVAWPVDEKNASNLWMPTSSL
jgi:multimeric flavodoxin WrbA